MKPTDYVIILDSETRCKGREGMRSLEQEFTLSCVCDGPQGNCSLPRLPADSERLDFPEIYFPEQSEYINI